MYQEKTIKAAGTTFSNRQNYLRYLVMQNKAYKLFLVREPRNKADGNAIKILAKTDDKKTVQIGYIPRKDASILAPLMDAGTFIQIAGSRITGGFDLNFGMTLDLKWS